MLNFDTKKYDDENRLRLNDNAWSTDGSNLFLTFAKAGIEGREHDDSDLYYVPLDRLCGSEEIVDWIAQITEKNWATDKVLADFVRAVDMVVGLR